MSNLKFLINSIKNDSYGDFVQNIYKYNKLINATNLHGETLVFYAAHFGFLDKYYAIINMNGMQVLLTNEGNNLLHYAMYSGNDFHIIRESIKENSLFSKNKNGETPIHLVSNLSIANYIYFMLQYDINKLISNIDNFGNTILHSAKIYNHMDVYNYFSMNIPQLNEIKNNDGLLPSDYLIPKKHNFCTE